jgi:nucleoside-diphosphate-sugar epimerase
MKIFVVGGSGYLGRLVLPPIAQRHTLRVFDLAPPADPNWEYVPGNVADYEALARAMPGADALIYMAMGDKNYETIRGITSNFDVNVKGVHLALHAAHQAGIAHAVYTSSMSVYYKNLTTRAHADEDLPPDETHLYGLTKRLGEEVCRSATIEWGMSVNALRLFLPMPEEEWLASARPGEPIFATTAEDVARALLAALEYRAGFETFTITGDYAQQHMLMDKAKRLLGWEPLARPRS